MQWYFIRKQIGGTAMDATNQPRFILIPLKNFLKEKESYLDLEIEMSGEQNLKRHYCLF